MFIINNEMKSILIVYIPKKPLYHLLSPYLISCIPMSLDLLKNIFETYSKVSTTSFVHAIVKLVM